MSSGQVIFCHLSLERQTFQNTKLSMIGTHQTNLESLYLHFSVLCQLEKYCPFYLFIDLNNDVEFGKTTFQEFYQHHKVEVTMFFFSK